MGYSTVTGQVDLTKIAFTLSDSYTPISTNGGNVSYLWTIPGCAEYTINKDTFDWPSESSTVVTNITIPDPNGGGTNITYTSTSVSTANHLSFGDFHNQTITSNIVVTQGSKNRVIYTKDILLFEAVGVPSDLDGKLEWNLDGDENYGTGNCEWKQNTRTVEMAYASEPPCGISECAGNRRKDMPVKVRIIGQSQPLVSTTLCTTGNLVSPPVQNHNLHWIIIRRGLLAGNLPGLNGILS